MRGTKDIKKGGAAYRIFAKYLLKCFQNFPGISCYKGLCIRSFLTFINNFPMFNLFRHVCFESIESHSSAIFLISCYHFSS